MISQFAQVKECIRSGLTGTFELIFSNRYSKLNQKVTFKDRQPKYLKSDLVSEIIKCISVAGAAVILAKPVVLEPGLTST